MISFAKSNFAFFAKALNESVIEASISIELESTTTSKFAVKSAAAKVRLFIESVTLLVDRPIGFEVVVELTSILISCEKGENKIRPILAEATYSLDSNAAVSSSRTESSVELMFSNSYCVS